MSAATILPHEQNCPIPSGTVPNPYAPNVVVADLNNDGKPDLILPVLVPNPSIVGGQSTAIWTFLGNGDGTFQDPQKFKLATVPTWLAVGISTMIRCQTLWLVFIPRMTSASY